MMSDDALHLIDDEPVDVDEGSPWEVLVVDDDPEVHEATRFALRGTRVQGRPLHLTHAYSAREARELLRQSVEPAVVLLDVVMETDQAGLDLVDFIRTACGLRRTRIILRTGQPGYAPELGVVARYDINDYRTKSELTRNRLLTALTAAIRSYEQISTIAENRRGLELIVRAAPRLLRPQPVDTFAGAVLEHLCELIGTPVDGVFCAHAAPPGVEYSPMQVVGACGGLHDVCGEGLATIRDERCRAMLRTALAQRGHLFGEHEAVLHLEGGEDDAAVYASIPGRALTETDRQLLEVFAANITGCFANLRRFEQVNYVAYHDALTGLLNRSGFVRALDGRGSDGPRWVALIDLRGFAELSDGLGQAVGNALLVAVANRLRAQLGADCLLARVGGDVFGACGPAPQVNADTLLALFDEPFPCGEHRLPARVSLGLVELPTGSGQGLVTLSRAGIALNIAKHGRQGHHVVFLPAMEEHMRERLALAQRLREALRAGALEVWFQPQVALDSGKVVGLEALARWQLADAPGGWCSPAVFVPLAESSGLIGALGEFVLDRACAALAGLADVGGRELRIAVNVAMPQLRQAGFAGRVQAIMEQHGVSPRQLEIEITESVALEEPDIVREGLGALRALGTSVAIDDFGTGYSSLAQLRDMPIDVLKLDRSFVQGVVEEQGAAFVETIVRMAQRLGLETVGEGVETTGQADCLRRLGCDVAQGYLFARPMPLAALREWLVHREPGGA